MWRTRGPAPSLSLLLLSRLIWPLFTPTKKEKSVSHSKVAEAVTERTREGVRTQTGIWKRGNELQIELSATHSYLSQHEGKNGDPHSESAAQRSFRTPNRPFSLPLPFASFIRTNLCKLTFPVTRGEEHLSRLSHPLPQSQQILYLPPQLFRRRRPPLPVSHLPGRLFVQCVQKRVEKRMEDRQV